MGWQERMSVVLIAWIPLTVLLFRLLGPRRAVLIGIVGGYVLLPLVTPFARLSPPFRFVSLPTSHFRFATTPPGVWFEFTKEASISIGLGAWDRSFDWRRVARTRPHWLDLVMLAYVAYPLTGIMVSGSAACWDSLGMVLQRGLFWLVPYLAGRLYFRRRRRRSSGRRGGCCPA